MSNILDLATAKIEFKMMGKFLAKVTLNWQDQFEVRFFRITARPNNSLWFQPPALKEFGYAKCFGVLDQNEWKRFENRILDQFKAELAEKVAEGVYSQDVLDKYTNPEPEITEEDWDKIDKAIG